MTLSKPIAALWLFVFAAIVITSVNLHAQEKQEELQPGFPWTGVITASKLQVRCGPGSNYYRVATLKTGGMAERGTLFKVYKAESNKQGDWVAIAPPKDAFLYVHTKLVKRSGANSGLIQGNRVNVRAPSPSGPDKSWKIITQMNHNDVVTVLEAEGEWLKIKPPLGVYFYVAAQYVAKATPEQIAALPKPEPAEVDSDKEKVSGDGDQVAMGEKGKSDDFTKPEVKETPATQPAKVDKEAMAAIVAFKDAEAAYSAMDSKPVEEQPIESMLADYKALLANEHLGEVSKEKARLRIKILNTRLDLQEKLVELAKTKAKVAQMEKAKEKEALKKVDMSKFIAVGRLESSAVYDGRNLPLRYRLVDATSGLTVAYVMPSNEETEKQFLDKIVGINGTSAFDETTKLKVITPTKIVPLTAVE